MKKSLLGQYFALIAVFFVSLTLVFTIPNSWVSHHVDISRQAFKLTGDYPNLNPADPGSRLDNFTDALMLREAASGGDNPIKSAMNLDNYPRYWHGYLVWLRPLLSVMSYSAIRQLYALILFSLIALTMYLMAKRFDLFVVLAFAVSLMFQRLFSMFISLQFSHVTFIMLGSTITLLAMSNRRFEKLRVVSFFWIVGSLTNFVDLLTFPLVTLGVPLIVSLYRRSIAQQNMLGSTIIYAVKAVVSWFLGYAITWLLTWILSSLVLGKNVIQDAAYQILFRTEGSSSIPVTRLAMLKANLRTEFSSANLLVLILVIVMFGILLWGKMNRGLTLNTDWGFLAVVGVLSLLPYMWYLVLANHSQIHYWFTYREQMVTIFAWLMMLSRFARVATHKRVSDVDFNSLEGRKQL